MIHTFILRVKEVRKTHSEAAWTVGSAIGTCGIQLDLNALGVCDLKWENV